MVMLAALVYLVCVGGGLLAYRRLCRAVDRLLELKGTRNHHAG